MMSKKNIRLLALGFGLSALLLITLNGLFQTESNASNGGRSDDLQAEIHYLEEKVVSLELENESLVQQLDNSELAVLSDEAEESSENTEETEEEIQEEESLEEEDEEENTEEDSEEENVATTYTVVVNENEPSSVIADQLVEFGLIEDRHAFNTYLEESGAYLRVRAGSYTVSSEMNREELVQAIID